MHDAFSLFLECRAKLLNVPQIFDSFGPTGCQIVESFSAISVQSGVKLSNLPHLFDSNGYRAEHSSLLLVNRLS